MPFSKNPALSTYQTKMVELFKQPNNRGSTAAKDEDLVNCFYEITQNRKLKDEDIFIVKRAGVVDYIPAVAGDSVRGAHYNEDFRKLYYCVSDTMYIWSLSTGSISSTLTTFFGTTTGKVGFCDYLYDDGTQVIIATDGTTLKQITSGDVPTANVDGDMPTHIPQPVFLDGYLFVVKTNSSDIYNSNLNNPLAWTPGDFISAEINPDISRAIGKLNNYIVVFSSTTIEYFWDAANETASPLQRNDTPVKYNGYLGGLTKHGAKLYFVGNDVDGYPDVYALEDFKIEPLGTESLRRYLSSLDITFANIKGSVVAIQGHMFYVLNAGTSTYVMDLENKVWTRWAYQDETNFPIDFAFNTKRLTSYKPIIIRTDSTSVEEFDEDLYEDNGEDMVVTGVTDNEYFDTYNQKVMHRLVVWGDKPTSSASLQLQWSDDDYQTWSTAVNIDLYQERPSITRMGRFRRRAFKWTFTENHPLRLKGFEVDINKGQT
jgi:hypothetical protein